MCCFGDHQAQQRTLQLQLLNISWQCDADSKRMRGHVARATLGPAASRVQSVTVDGNVRAVNNATAHVSILVPVCRRHLVGYAGNHLCGVSPLQQQVGKLSHHAVIPMLITISDNISSWTAVLTLCWEGSCYIAAVLYGKRQQDPVCQLQICLSARHAASTYPSAADAYKGTIQLKIPYRTA